ncbi:MAG: HEAT repeat domain-containing protein [Actinomycetota bacterium]|nr:HEAT repeat domain-containing protein [Actinomycetota bacterium]
MSGFHTVELFALVVFGVNAVLVAGLITLKTVHRRRTVDYDRRRSHYVTVLSRHLAFENCADPLGRDAATDPAFLDALIDVRRTVVGPELTTLGDIASRYGIITELMHRLRRGRSRGQRLRAAVALAELGDGSSARVLMDHLSDHEAEVRLQAARGLGRMQWTPAIDGIVNRLEVETPWLRARFADTLVGFGGKATAPLTTYVRVNHPFETYGPVTAVKTLATIGDSQAVTPLLEVLEEAENPEVEIAVIEALGILGGPAVIAPLQRKSDSPDWRVRAKVATGLGTVGDPSSAPILARAMCDANWWVRRNAAAALAKLPGGSDSLYAAIDGPDPYAGDAAAEALADRGDLEAARDRQAVGETTALDEKLLAYVEAVVEVPA